MTLGEYWKTEGGQRLIALIDDHALFYLNAIYGDYLVVSSTTGGCHEAQKHPGIRLRQFRSSRYDICILCRASLMAKGAARGNAKTLEEFFSAR